MSSSRSWRWVVLVACFVSAMLNSAMFYAFGIFVLPWMDEFSATGASIAAVASWAAALTSLLCPIGTIFIQKWGYRWVHATGGCILMLSFALSSFAQSIGQLFFTHSILGGFGSSLCLGSFVVAVSEHFHDQQGLGFAITTSAYGFGGFIFPLLFEGLIQSYTRQGAMLVLSGLFGHIIPCGLLLYPVDQSPPLPACGKISSKKQVKCEHKQTGDDVFNHNKKLSSDDITSEHYSVNKDAKVETKTVSEHDKSSTFQLIKILLKSWSFYIMMLHDIFLFMGYFIVLGLTPIRARYDLNLTKQQSKGFIIGKIRKMSP